MATSSEVLLGILAEAGVRRIWGMPGDAINGLVEAIRRQDRIEFIQVRHEEAGAFAASAHAKLTGELGVCCGTAGPGAIHLLNGLYDAKLDSAPVLALTGQVDSDLIGTRYHQEVDLHSLFEDVSAFNQVATSPRQVPGLVVRACQVARSRRTVAHLSLPADVANADVPGDAPSPAVLVPRAETVPCDGDLGRAAVLLDEAEKPLILAGEGCRDARDELLGLAERLGAPVVRSLRAKDVVPDDHPLCLGGLGLLGTRPAVDAVNDCDLLILAGTDFPYADFYPKGTRAVQIDLDPGRLGSRHPVEVGLAGHARPTLAALAERVGPHEERPFLEKCQEAMRDWTAKMEQTETVDRTPLSPQAVARRVGDAAADDAIFVCDTGTVTVWGARNLRIREGQRFVLSSSLGSMAFALPGAIGAQLGHPDRQVIALAGDGGLSMLMTEFLTAVKYRLPLTVVVFDNGKLGLIQMEQEVEGHPEYETALQAFDFARFAELCGGRGARVETLDELDDALGRSLDDDAPWILDVVVDPEERTMPPRIELSQAFGYALAKMREVFGQGDREGGLDVLKDAVRPPS
jgi:pyruvate oxidase